MKINEFPNITILGDTDLLLVQTTSDGAYKNISVSDFKKNFNVAGSNDSGNSTGNNNGSNNSGTTTTNNNPGYSTPNLALWLEDGSLIDKSGNGNNAIVTGTKPPFNVPGIDKKGSLYWDGSGTQEIRVNPFLTQAKGSTLFLVFTITSDCHYDMIHTADNGSLWHYENDNNGYLGTFLTSRIEQYPSSMPTSGSHLAVIQSNSQYLQFILDNTSKGIRPVSFNAGSEFIICPNAPPFNGSISLLLVYNKELVPGQSDYEQTLTAIKSNYPSLTLAS